MVILKDESSDSSRSLLANTLRRNDMLNIVKLFAAICVIGIHCTVFADKYLNYAFQQWFARFAVPLFFVSSGFYFSKMNDEKRNIYLKRIGVLYLISMIAYSYFWIPRGGNHFILATIRTILFGYHHLWYLSALFMALVLTKLWYKLNLNDRWQLIVVGILLLAGIFLGVYYKYLPRTLYEICDFFKHVGRGRNFATFGFPLVLLGDWLYRNREKVFSVAKRKYFILLFISCALSLIEVFLVKKYLNAYSDVLLFNWPIGVFIFILTFYAKPFTNGTDRIRKLADYIYIVHPLVITIVYKIVGFRNIYSFLMIVVFSVIASFAVNSLIDFVNAERKSIA